MRRPGQAGLYNPTIVRPCPKPISYSLFALERIKSLLSRPHLNHVLNIVYENLAISDISRIKSFLGSFNHLIHGNLADNHFQLYLMKYC